jgi:hypothetical protein
VALAASVAGIAATPQGPSAGMAAGRFTGQVTDALRTPAHRLAVGAGRRRAAADLVFVDAQHAQTSVRACVRRRDVEGVRTCFGITTGEAGAPTVTPLRFQPGSYVARWSVDGAAVAAWRFVVVAAG